MGGERNGTYTEANSLEVTQCIEFTIFTGRVSTSKQNSNNCKSCRDKRRTNTERFINIHVRESQQAYVNI